jgi:hypothetical protein
MVGSTRIDHRDFALRISRLEIHGRPNMGQVSDHEIARLDLPNNPFVDVVVVFQAPIKMAWIPAARNVGRICLS